MLDLFSSFFLSLPPPTSFFLFNVEFHTLKQTGGSGSEIREKPDRHPHILTYSYDFCVWQQVFDLRAPLSLQRRTIYKMGPVLFGRCPKRCVFPPLALCGDKEI